MTGDKEKASKGKRKKADISSESENEDFPETVTVSGRKVKMTEKAAAASKRTRVPASKKKVRILEPADSEASNDSERDEASRNSERDDVPEGVEGAGEGRGVGGSEGGVRVASNDRELEPTEVRMAYCQYCSDVILTRSGLKWFGHGIGHTYRILRSQTILHLRMRLASLTDHRNQKTNTVEILRPFFRIDDLSRSTTTAKQSLKTGAGANYAGEYTHHSISERLGPGLMNMNTYHREDTAVKKKKGPLAGWYKGGNSTCRRHIASKHYVEYSKRCKDLSVEESREAVPKKVWEDRVRAKAVAAGEKGAQKTLDSTVKKIETPSEFSKRGILESVTIHVVCDDQVGTCAAVTLTLV